MEALIARNRELEQRLALHEGQMQASSSSTTLEQSGNSVSLPMEIAADGVDAVGFTPCLTAELNNFLSGVGDVQSSSLSQFRLDDMDLLDAGLPAPGPYSSQEPEEDPASIELALASTSSQSVGRPVSLRELDEL